MATRSATRIRTCAAALLLALFVLTAPAGAAEAQPTVLSSSTDSFVPDHGGEDDSARLDVRVPSGARYTVVVRTRDGHTVRVLHNGWLRKGTAQVFWDGRSDAGDVLEPGNYRIHVRRGSSNIATAPVVVRAPRVSVWGLSTGRAYIAGHNRAPAILARYRLNAAASVSAAVVRADGVVVRTLVSGSQARGKRSLHWNGRTNTGVYAPDGSYTIMINASGGGFPSGTLRLPVRVDRTAPVVRARAGRLAARTQSTGLFVRVPISLSERSTVIASARRGRTWRATVNPGRRVLKIRASDVGISQGRRARTWRLRITARDATTNTGSAVLSVAVAGRPPEATAGHPAAWSPPSSDLAGAATTRASTSQRRPGPRLWLREVES
jgi:flagellar hook assembly protein FlgD